MIEKFIKENLERDVKSFVTNDELYSRYLLFCKANEIAPITKIKLTNQLKVRGQGIKNVKSIKGVKYTVRHGLRLKSCPYSS